MKKTPLVALLALTLVSNARPAPAPFYRHPPPTLTAQQLYGSWQCSWMGSMCRLVFSPGGHYYCERSGRVWAGTWYVRAGILFVTESEVDDPLELPAECWCVRLDPVTLRGHFEDSNQFGPFELTGQNTIEPS